MYKKDEYKRGVRQKEWEREMNEREREREMALSNKVFSFRNQIKCLYTFIYYSNRFHPHNNLLLL
jgi:hypothetical protein